MADENNSSDPRDRNYRKDPTRTYIDDRRSPADAENDMQVDPVMTEGPASNSRITLFAIGIAVILGVVFYGLNNSSLQQQQASTAPIHTNSQPGTTTGAAPAKPQTPSPASTNPGGAATNTANPGNAPAKK